MRRVGKYEVGRTIGEGTFAKVKFARNTETGVSFAMKVLAKSTILKHKMVKQASRQDLLTRLRVLLMNMILNHLNGVNKRIEKNKKNLNGIFKSVIQDHIQRKRVCDSGGGVEDFFDILLCTEKNGFLTVPFDKDSIKAMLLIKREISIMKMVRHPNIVRLHEVLSSKTKIYIVLEFITGGELYDKIVHQGRLTEHVSRRYFQQLIDAVDYCHRKGVYHRDLKPENLLLDFQGNLKISDFGLSALPQQGVELLYTTCGTPNYVAPEVLGYQGYDGSVADIWSCGVILFVIMAGYLPFDETNLSTLYKKIRAADFSFPPWFSSTAKLLISRILDPNPKTRIQIAGIKKDPWFKKNYVAVKCEKDEEVSLDDVRAVFDDIEDQYVSEQTKNDENGPLVMNAFEMITLSQGLNLSALFDRRQDFVKRQTRFVSRKPAKVIISSIEGAAESMGLTVHSRNYKMRLEGISANRTGQFAVVLVVYEVAPSLFMVDVRKASGDTFEYHKFYKDLCNKLEDIIWKSGESTESTKRSALC